MPFQKPQLSSEERANDLVSRLTLEEKATLMCTYQRLDNKLWGNSRLLQQILCNNRDFMYLFLPNCDAIGDFEQNHKVFSDATHATKKVSLQAPM